MDPHLVLNRAAANRIAFAQRTVVADHQLGDDEQGNTLDGIGRADALGEDQMDDVVGQVMLARRDEDLGPADGVGTIVIGLGPGLDQAKVGAAMRLGQVHRSGPESRNHVGQIFCLLLVRSLGDDRRDRPGGQAVIHFKRLVGRQDIFADRRRDDVGKPLPAKFLRRRQRRPAALAELLIRRLEPGRRGHRSVGVPGAAFMITDLVERGQNLGGEPPALGQDRLDQIGSRAGEPGKVRIMAKLNDMIEDELRVADGGGISGHLGS